jgi:uncharacterized protein YydD (DUF2326 family)
LIHRVFSNRPEFKDVSFEPGFNVVLAERTTEASDKASRNGSGKTSLVEVIHFCLGSGFNRDHPLADPALAGWQFSLDFDLAGHRVVVSRDTAEPRRIWIERSGPDWPVDLKLDADRGKSYLTVDEWKTVLGALAFDLDPALADQKFTPGARGLMSYFIRKGRDAFVDPFSYFRGQPSWDRQVHTALLLGLDWNFARRAELLNQQEDQLRKAHAAVEAWRASVEASESADVVPRDATEGSLEATRIVLAQRVRAFQESLDSFQVHPQYHDFERRASSLTEEIHDLVNQNVVARDLLRHYARSLGEESVAPATRLEELYAELGVHFPETVVERLEAVRDFHTRVAMNRQEYLQSEMGRIEDSIATRDARIATLSEQRAELLRFLDEHGALEEFITLQQQHRETLEQLARVEAEIEQLRRFEDESARLRIEREELRLAARRDFDDRRELWHQAVELFASNTAALYEKPGQLILDVSTSGGLTYSCEIERKQSQGVQEMVIFSYDLMLAQRWARAAAGLGVLVHDTSIFDGVDERQFARALELAKRSADEYGFQYICLLNSDQVPWDEFEELDLRSHVALELTDADEAGGLFGIRFG